jgi:hypothetical protein
MNIRHIAPAAAALNLLFVDAVRASSQTPASAGSSQARSQAIAASFSKFKNVSKEKRGIRKDKYVRVQSEPAVKANPEQYSGTYEVPEFGFAIHLRVDRSGGVEGDGYEPFGSDPNVRRAFTLKNGKVQGALLTATKVYANGSTEKLEGVFLNRTRFESPTDKGNTAFGLGVVGRTIEISGNTYDKLFYELRSQ